MLKYYFNKFYIVSNLHKNICIRICNTTNMIHQHIILQYHYTILIHHAIDTDMFILYLLIGIEYYCKLTESKVK